MTEAAPARKVPAPLISPENRAFWEAAAAGRLLLRWCMDCGKPHWYPRPVCPRCFSDRSEWKPASGHATVYSFTHIPGPPPLVVAYVQLDEGITMLSNIVRCPPDQVRIGQALRLAFATAENGQAVPVFEPA
jgi:uncharacterized OB-fold protein